MPLVFEKMTQTLAAGEILRLGVAGDFVRICEAAYAVKVTLLKGGRVIGSMAGMLAGDYVRDVDFDAVWVTNGTTPQVITLQVAGGGVGSDRVLGEVSVINGELARVKANQCFMGVISNPQVAGQCGLAQLWNPAASGKNLILNKVSILAVAGGVFAIFRHNVALTLGYPGMSKVASGAASAAEVRSGASAANIGSQYANFGVASANESKDFAFSEPFVIPPGWGIHTSVNTPNTAAYTTFQWIEEGI